MSSEIKLFALLRRSPRYGNILLHVQIEALRAILRDPTQRGANMPTALAPAMKDLPVKVYAQDWEDLRSVTAHLKDNGYPEITVTALTRIALHLLLDEMAERHLVGEQVEVNRAARLVCERTRAVHPADQARLRDALRKVID